MDLRQSEAYASYQARQGWQIVKMEGGKGGEVQLFLKQLPVLGVSILKGQRFEGSLKWKELEKVKREYKVIYTVLEPSEVEEEELKARGYKLSSSPYLPTETIVIDLGKTKEELWEELRSDAKRTIEESKVRVQKIDEGEEKRFWQKWKEESKIKVPGWKRLQDLKECFKDKIWLLGSYSKDEMVAGGIILMTRNKGYYYYAWTDEQGRKKGGQYKLVWETIKRLKEVGKEGFDLEGIEDKRWPRKSWRGFSLFKRKFGGERIRFPGSFTKWF